MFDLKLQLAFQHAALLGFLAWLWLRPPAGGAVSVFLGELKWLWAAGLLSLAALLASPLRGWIYNEWGNFGAGLLLFAWSSFLNKESRDTAWRAVAVSAWAVFALTLAQALLPGRGILTPLSNHNAVALFALLVAPPAIERRDWHLAAAMGWLLLNSRSSGALLAASVVGAVWVLRLVKEGGDRRLLLLPLAAAALAFFAVNPESLQGRLAWWQRAWLMFLERPLTGFGYAGYTWAQGGFGDLAVFRESSVYAHNYYLEFLAENGLPAALCWFWFLYSAAGRRGGAARYSVLAALLHSCVDFGLSVPANFWLFCFLAAEPAAAEAAAAPPQRSAGLKAAFAAALLLEGALLLLGAGALRFERARRAAWAAPAGEAAAALGPYTRPGLLRGPALEYLGQLSLRRDAAQDGGLAAAAYFEETLLENPYSPRAWQALARVYAAPGLEIPAAGLKYRREAVYR